MPAPWFDIIRAPFPLRLLGRPVQRVHLYLAAFLLAGAASALGIGFPRGWPSTSGR